MAKQKLKKPTKIKLFKATLLVDYPTSKGVKKKGETIEVSEETRTDLKSKKII